MGKLVYCSNDVITVLIVRPITMERSSTVSHLSLSRRDGRLGSVVEELEDIKHGHMSVFLFYTTLNIIPDLYMLVFHAFLLNT